MSSEITREPLSGDPLMEAVRDVLILHPERHEQSTWVDSRFGTFMQDMIDVEGAREFAGCPIPDEPAVKTFTGNEAPACGTTGCVAGWGAIFAAPAGAKLYGYRIYLPDGPVEQENWAPISEYAQGKLGLTSDQADWMFRGSRKRYELIGAMNLLLAERAAHGTSADVPVWMHRYEAEYELYGESEQEREGEDEDD